MSPGFDPAVTAYTATTNNSTDIVQATPAAPSAQVTIRCGNVDVASGGSATWQAGANALTIAVANGDATMTYTAAVTYTPTAPSNARLSALSIGSLTFDPAFSPDVFGYTVTTSNATNTITATPADSEAEVTIDIDGQAHANGTPVTWKDGENVVTIAVKAGDATEAYIVTVTKS